MLKRVLRALFLLPLLASPAFAVGTIAYSLSQQFDQFGAPLTGCLMYTIQAGTTSTPQNSYKDTALTNPQPNPLVCDSSGRLPQFFLADGQIKIRLTDKFGNPIVTTDNILVIGPSSGGGSGATIDPTTIAATGDLKTSYGTQVITGWVRLNGRTIGSATSGATERANSDTQALFQYLWSADTNLVVVSGRGATSIADWTANKQLTVPDGRGKALAGLDDMGNSAFGMFTGATFTSGTATTLGSIIGASRRTLTLAQIPTGITSPVTVTSGANTVPQNPNAPTVIVFNSGSVFGYYWGSNPGGASPLTSTGTATSNNTGGQAHDTISPYLLATIYIKL